MNDIVKNRNAVRAQKVIEALASRNVEACYAENKEEALKLALSLIPEGSTIGWGGTVTVGEIGLFDALKQGNYHLLDRSTAQTTEEREKLMRDIMFADVFLTSCNAMSEDGVIVNVDGFSNRIAAIAFGPKKVVMVVGMNKLVKTAEDALHRARYEAAPMNASRFNVNTPCKKTGCCADCKSPDTICCNVLTTRYSRGARIKVVLVNEDLGF